MNLLLLRKIVRHFATCALLSMSVLMVSDLANSQELRDLDSHCPFAPPETLEAWQARAADVQLQLEVALGLHPRLELDPVAPQIYGRIARDGYTIEKCIFESLPGFFVTGNLYRPSGLAEGIKSPGILCPHGHWNDARFYDLSPQERRKLIAIGAERFDSAARNHIQARCVQLARMGCVVFHWDMIGYCDSTQISLKRAHGFESQAKESEVTDDGWLLFSPKAESNLQSVLGLQSLAILRAVDMLTTLADVDPARIAITGASGGGTQSFLGAAIDERIQVAFPAVMVSTGMQGGCTCENCCLLRTGTGNVEMAALIAPRPLGLTAANDWTVNLASDGFPELQSIYKLLGVEQQVALFPATHFDHNFNHVARTSMYGWMSDHLGLGLEKPILETDFDVALREQLSVWDEEHPRPEGGEAFERKLMKLWGEIVDVQFKGLLHGDAQQNEKLLATLREGWRVCLGLTTRFAETAQAATLGEATEDATEIRISLGSQKPLAFASDRQNKEQPLVGNPRLAAAYTYGYNLPAFAEDAQQLALALLKLSAQAPQQSLRIEASGANAALATAAVFCAEELAKSRAQPIAEINLVIDPQDFAFSTADSIRSYHFVPGSERYWDFAGLCKCLKRPIEFVGQSDLSPFKRLDSGTE